jgi:hypothetical protein
MEHYLDYHKNLSLDNIIYVNARGKLCIESWRHVKGFKGYYKVSNCGRVKGLTRKAKYSNHIRTLNEAIIVAPINAKGYREIKLCKDGKVKYTKVHILVAEAFIPNPLNLPQVNHKKGIKIDNRQTELEWMTNRQNCIHYRLEQKTSSKYVGVMWNPKANKWIARIKVNGKNIHLGTFEIEEDAHKAYQKALKQVEETGTYIKSKKHKIIM